MFASTSSLRSATKLLLFSVYGARGSISSGFWVLPAPKITAESFAAKVDGSWPSACSEAPMNRHSLWHQDCEEKTRKYLNLICNASFDRNVAITGQAGTESKVSVLGSVTSHELNWSAGVGCREGLERGAHLCSFSFPGSHISQGIWFSVITTMFCLIFVAILYHFPVWGRIFSHPNVLVIIFQTFWSFCCQILTHYGNPFGIWDGVRRKLVQTLCQHYEICVSLLQLPWHMQAASSWSDGELLLGAEKLFGMW